MAKAPAPELARVVGIDLGTTYSLVAVLQAGQPLVLESELGERLLPSAVSVDGDTVLVGSAAKARATTYPTATARWFKRDMGTSQTRTLSGRTFRPEELSALVLQELKQTAERALGARIVEAVVTVPAYFGELQRRATRDACELAGLHVERIINEPTAAALAYGLHHQQEQKAVVLDLGGGTFDVTVLEIMEGVIEIQASAGDARLGGEDFADALARYWAEQLRSEVGASLGEESTGWARLREAAEGAKCRLTEDTVTRVALPDLPIGSERRNVEFEITRERADEIWRPLLERIRVPIRRALRDAKLSPQEIDEVILVGGATRMPCFVSLATQLFQRLPLRSLPPDESVALGAAVAAALKEGNEAVEDMVVTDVAPFSLGIAVGNRIGTRTITGIFSPILERGTVLPASRVETFSTIADGQRSIEIEVFQGEHSLCKDNQRLGAYTVSGIPPGPAGNESVEVRFTYDLNGILEVDTTILATKQTKSLLIEKTPGGLGPEELKRVKAGLRRLKFHPRDALPNVTALNRAESLYLELTGDERDWLGSAMTAFRVALERQDPRSIEALRVELMKRVRVFKDI